MLVELGVILSSGGYTARLSLGGDCAVLCWNLPGAELRYHHGFAEIPVDRLQEFELAVREAFAESTAASAVGAADGGAGRRATVHRGFHFEVGTGGPFTGLRVFPGADNSFRCLIRTEAELDEFCALLREAGERCEQLQPLAC